MVRIGTTNKLRLTFTRKNRYSFGGTHRTHTAFYWYKHRSRKQTILHTPYRVGQRTGLGRASRWGEIVREDPMIIIYC